jgi:hypothetical protein
MEHKTSVENKPGIIQSRFIKINRVKSQGDSLSPLLFCIALISLTSELNGSKCGYQVYGSGREINHLLYMDDLKLIGRS